MAVDAPNPLLATSKPSDALLIKLHPLVLLTISDFITRHSLRGQHGPIVGAVIGQQNGREITMEHAFECNVKAGEAINEEERVILDENFFATRLEQYKDVHKAPALDLVAIFTLGSPSGPQPQHIPMLQQVQHLHHDDTLLALFHPETILQGNLSGGKLPFSLYESYYEPGSENADKGMQAEGWGTGRQLQVRFKELAFEVETGEAEMIGVDFVAKGGGNATAVADAAPAQSETKTSKGKGKAKDVDTSTDQVALSPEDDELIASLTSKANAIKMLHQRISLIQSYLSTLPESYLTNPSLPPSTSTDPNHALLRNISALLSRLPLLEPPSSAAPTNGLPQSTSVPPTASAKESSDVNLVSLLSSLTRTIAETREFGSKNLIVSRAKGDRKAAQAAKGPPLIDLMGNAGRFDDFEGDE